MRSAGRRRYNVINLFMQYNLAHSNYNSAKFNWIVYRRRSLAARYRNKRRYRPRLTLEPPRPNSAPSLLFLLLFSFSFALRHVGRRRKTKEIPIDFPLSLSLSFLNSTGRTLVVCTLYFHRDEPDARNRSDFIISRTKRQNNWNRVYTRPVRGRPDVFPWLPFPRPSLFPLTDRPEH